MIIQIVRHDVRDGMLDVAMERISAMTNQMSQHAGFVFRQVGQVIGHDMRIMTVTAWLDVESIDRWEEMRKTAPLPEIPGEDVYSFVESFRVDTAQIVPPRAGPGQESREPRLQ